MAKKDSHLICDKEPIIGGIGYLLDFIRQKWSYN